MIKIQNHEIHCRTSLSEKIREPVDLYIAHLHALNRSPHTVRLHTTIINELDHFLQKDRHNLTNAVRSQISAFLFNNTNPSPKLIRGIHRRMSCIKSFYRFLSFVGQCDTNPSSGIPLPKLPKALPRDILSISEASRLLNCPPVNTAEGIMHRTILEVLYSTGLRLREICNLTLNDIDYTQHQVTVRNGKGGKDRVVPLGHMALHYLKRYMQQSHPRQKSNLSIILFVDNSNKPIKPDAIQRMLRLYAAGVAPGKRITPHTMRHTFATHLIMNGASVSHVQKLLGHKDISTTQIYLRLAPCELKRIYRKCHPLERHSKPILLRRPKNVFNKEHIPTPPMLNRSRSANCAKPLSKHLAEFAIHLYSLNRSPRAVHTLLKRINLFLNYAESFGAKSLDQITPELLVKYQCHITELRNQHGHPVSIAVRNQYLSAVACFTRYLHFRDILPTNPMQDFLLARQPSRIPGRIPNEKEMLQILQQPDTKSILGLRDRTIMETLYATGIRKQELINLKHEDIDFEHGLLTVRCGKGQRDRVVPIGKRALKYISFYIKHARHHFVSDSKHPGKELFLSVCVFRSNRTPIPILFGHFRSVATLVFMIY